jgi:hypothetical protein
MASAWQVHQLRQFSPSHADQGCTRYGAYRTSKEQILELFGYCKVKLLDLFVNESFCYGKIYVILSSSSIKINWDEFGYWNLVLGHFFRISYTILDAKNP